MTAVGGTDAPPAPRDGEHQAPRRGRAAREGLRSAGPRARLLLEEVGDVMILTGKTLISAVRPPYPYGDEFIAQFLFALRQCFLPLMLTIFCVAYSVPGLQAANFLTLFGALDRMGGLFTLAVVRELGPIICAIVVAGAAGTAITADLGARKIREELDALQVLGVDPVKNLVVPRFLALILLTGLFDVFAIVFGITGGLVATLIYGARLEPFFATFFTSSSITDLWGSVVKSLIFGGVTAIICCYKGMTVSGGAAGVGRAVNQAIVVVFLGIGAVNYVFTQTLLATHPEINLIR
ncbi:ABC transporter permease [Conexibacter arvalis]|uniref:Phospholipid/cholesterol/gamma-HCH transport system permease protein n=1 Tax=Conexibacter arvalis TaxID=912552 RepID=A0A840IK16_9ACTN|nr:phospholipid/cholesterol/gamma-HCH transport system permease protein [Conexibacter arvalis]